MESAIDHKYIIKGMSNEYGYFGIGPLQLEYNTTTTIAIICKWSTTEYEVVIRDVKSKFYGGYIVQDNFEFKYGTGSGYIPTLPANFSPPAKLKGHVECFSGNVHSIFPVYSMYTYGTMQDKVRVSYCVNEYIVNGENAKTTKWVRIGSTGYIWAEIDNIKLSYMFDFEVTKAYIKPSDSLNVCGDTSGTKMELEVIFPKANNPNTIKRDHILPNCVLLKSSKPQGFFNEDWTLYVEYKYKLLETSKANDDSDTEKVVWPADLDGENSMNRFVNPPFSLEQKENSFEVENIRYTTVAIMVYIEDHDGRIQSAVATKMLCDVVTTRCRPVEISYAYTADAIKYDLIPNSGFFTWTG
ncbi:hypothetical protein KAW18_13535, partial [candidate division WOR-3 bacterium]|nr:hypothetical protein [candidate division WOR-3 bacterium]